MSCNCHKLQFPPCEIPFNNYIKKALTHCWMCPVGDMLFNKGLGIENIITDNYTEIGKSEKYDDI